MNLKIQTALFHQANVKPIEFIYLFYLNKNKVFIVWNLKHLFPSSSIRNRFKCDFVFNSFIFLSFSRFYHFDDPNF